MERIQKSIEIERPLRVVYDQWTQFEDFPQFMVGVKEVRQLDDTHVHWHAEIFGKDKEWDAEIVAQVPDERIAWRSTSADTPNAGEVRFQPASDGRTVLHLTMEYDPEGLVENVGDAMGLLDKRVQDSVEGFKQFIENRSGATGAWRGEVPGGGTKRPI